MSAADPVTMEDVFATLLRVATWKGVSPSASDAIKDLVAIAKRIHRDERVALGVGPR